MNTKKLNEILNNYKTGCTVKSVTSNIFYTEYFLNPEKDYNFKRLNNNIINIQAFFDNKIILDIVNNKPVIKEENVNRPIVNFFDLWQVPDISYKLPLLIGVDSFGMPIYSDLTKMPHLLVAGTTGSGKSVFLHNVIMSLLKTNKSTLLLIDVKRVELTLYNGLINVECHEKTITSPQEAEQALKLVCDLMDRRYKEFEQLKVRNFEEYQKIKPNEKYLTVVIDELADLMLNKSIRKSIENSIVRIAQLARAVGIHLVVATQRPSTDVITGLIKANIPSRIAFNVASNTDSRVILDKSGAEKLNGNGDGLFKLIGHDTIRLQSCFINTDSIIDYVEQHKPQHITINAKPKKKFFGLF